MVRDPAADQTLRHDAGRAVAHLIAISAKVDPPTGTSLEERCRIDRECRTSRAPILAATLAPMLDLLRRDADRTGIEVALFFFRRMVQDCLTRSFIMDSLPDLGAICCRRLTAPENSPALSEEEIDLVRGSF